MRGIGLIATILTIFTIGCSSQQVSREPGSIGDAEMQMYDESKPIHLNDLMATPYGQSKQIAEWVSSNRYPALLGGYAVEDKAFADFENRMRKSTHFQLLVHQEEYRNYDWSGYCIKNPEECSLMMNRACRFVNDQSSAWLRLLKALQNAGFSKKEIQAELNTEKKCPRVTKKNWWWEGKGHVTPVVQTLFPQEPKSVLVGDQTLTKFELEIAAYLLAEKNSDRIRKINENEKSVSVVGLITALVNTYGQHASDQVFAVDADANFDIWSYLIKSYKMTFTDSPTPEEVNAIYAKIAAKNMSAPETTEGAVRFKKVLLELELASFPKPKNYDLILEFDKYDKLVGGEWLTEKHPDFVWPVPHQNIESTLNSPIQKQLYQWLTQ